MARVCLKNYWKKGEVISIPLNSFLEVMCADFQKEEALLGTNIDHKLFCLEFDPIELVEELLKELILQHKEIAFEEFESCDAFLQHIQSIS